MLQLIKCGFGLHKVSSINLVDCIEVFCTAPRCSYRRIIVNGKVYK